MLTALRSLLLLAWLVLTLVPYATVAVLVSAGLRGAPFYWFCSGWMRLAVQGARVICGIRWRLHGIERVEALDRAGTPVILAPKHQSAWETLALPALMPRPLAFVFKRELLYIPFFGWAIARLDMIHIDRSKRTQAWAKVAQQGARFLAAGHWVIMFPEGTRTPRGHQGSYKSGGARLALATGAVLLPVAVTSARCWPKGAFVKRPGVIDVSFGPPLAGEGRSPDALMAEAEAWIEAEMRRLDPEAYPEAYPEAAGVAAARPR